MVRIHITSPTAKGELLKGRFGVLVKSGCFKNELEGFLVDALLL